MIPADKILTNQYTRGNEYILKSTREYYQGYYCVVTDTKYYTGKTYDIRSKELLKVTLIPNQTNPISLPPQSTPIRYFIKKINIFPTIIKEVSEQTYSSYLNDPFYQTIAIRSDENLDQAEIQMPGIKTFLLG
jgi:hypothetical protein